MKQTHLLTTVGIVVQSLCKECICISKGNMHLPYDLAISYYVLTLNEWKHAFAKIYTWIFQNNFVKNRKWLRFHQPLKNETNYKILFNNKNEPSGHHTTTWMSLKSMFNDRNQVSTWNARKGRTIALGNKPESARGWKSGWTDYEAAHGQCCRWNCSVPW